MSNIKKIFNAGSVALIGATDKEGSVGRAILENLLLSKTRKVFPVNPNRKDVLGAVCYSSILDVKEKIGLAIIATPAKTVPAIVEECGKAGADGVIIVSAGFREIGDEGTLLEKQIKEIRDKYRMRII